MPLTGEEIRANLTRFVAHWSLRPGYERGEGQTFLTELFACYGQRLSDVAGFEHFQEGGFVDLLWERVCVVEMKSASEAKRLSKHPLEIKSRLAELHASIVAGAPYEPF